MATCKRPCFSTGPLLCKPPAGDYLLPMNTEPFLIVAGDEKPPRPRPLGTPGGLADRMRTAAFAERQAVHAFTWATGFFQDVPEALREQWLLLIPEEEKHFRLIMERMGELGFDPAERPVTTRLWDSLKSCTSGEIFCCRMAGAEERGRLAGVQLSEYLAERDPRTAAVFSEIAQDELAHVKLAETFFGWQP